jgi:hypothetical protein
LERTGPVQFDEDSWDDDESSLEDGVAEDYQGRRRARTSTRFWLLATLAVVVLGLAAAIPMMFASPRPLNGLSSGTGVPDVNTGGATSGAGTPAGSGSPGARPTYAGSPGASHPAPPLSSPSVTGSPGVTPTPSGTSTTFAPLILVAANQPNVPDWVKSSQCNNRTVVKLGGGYATITFGGISVPTAGSYTVAVSYDGGNNPTAVVQVGVNGTNTPVTFQQSNNCNGSLSLPVTLQAGLNTVTFTSTAKHNGDGPWLDHIVVSRP